MKDEANYPEAPISVSVTGYYKGFSVIATKRQPNEALKPLLEDAMKAIDWMANNGWKPSWRDGEAPRQPLVNTKICPVHQGTTMYEHNKNGKTWFSHKLADGTYCNGGPVRIASDAPADNLSF